MTGKENASKRRLIVDCQVLQTIDDRRRGMGFYLHSLLASVVQEKEAQATEFVFLLNKRLAGLAPEDKALIDSFGGRTLEGDFSHKGDCALFDQAALANRSNLDKLLKPLLTDASSAETIYFIPAMFSWEIYPVFPTHGTANLMLFHDLIPFLYHQQCLPDHEGVPRKDYAMRFREVYKADLFLANSQTTADDLTIYFGVDPARIETISGGPADRGKARPVPPKSAEQLQNGFVFMPSGDDFRKNNTLAVQAFAALQTDEKLVVTSNFTAGTQRVLRDLCPNIVFAGRASDEAMLWFFKNAKAVFYPPLYEGFALPLLEAVEANAAVACSNISVFAEVSKTAFCYFDPKSAASMTEALKKALHPTSTQKAELAKMKREYPEILANFTWAKAAKHFLRVIKKCQAAPARSKLAIFCPSPASYSSVGKYAFEVHAELSRYYDIDYFAEVGQTEFQPVRPNILEYAANYFPAGNFDPSKAGAYDHILYHIGNSEFKVDTILNALRLPAYALVHDTRLNGIFDYMQTHGFMPVERRDFEALLDDVFHCKHSSCMASIATNQKGLYCHSTHACQAIGEVLDDEAAKPNVIPHPIGVPGVELVRGEKPIISFAGIISEDKGIHLIAEVAKLENVLVKVFGYGVLGDSPLLHGLGSNVEIMTDLTDKDFQDALRSSDILINYRPNYHGETSRSALEAMRFGAAVIVNDVGWFGELPDGTVVKVTNEAELLDAVRSLVALHQKRQSIGAAARQFLREQYGYGRYAELIKSTLGDGTV